jgi:uncharacterized ferritin-like protein (DUF455 family)
MELRAFAERVLFGDRLEDKLVDPGPLTDDAPGGPLVSPPAFPGRPTTLRPTGDRFDFPDEHRLGEARARGEVLHFFANHELLALELMALALLRFPDAPPAFRRGIAGALAEEQTHLRLYVDRMAASGVALGDVPANRWFWYVLHDMRTPIDFVAGMSMTLEQANLDYSLHYRRAFERVGDTETAAVLQRVFEDEVRHVKLGRVWFERWQAADRDGTSLLERHARALRFPMTLARAKGRSFDAAARRAAGFDDAYIDGLRIYTHSKGRAPTVRLFNPIGEAALAHARTADGPYTPNAGLAALTSDLETLSMFVAAQDDIVAVQRPPAPGFLLALQKLGFALPEFSRLDTLTGRTIGAVEPWARTPDASRLVAGLDARRAEPDAADPAVVDVVPVDPITVDPVPWSRAWGHALAVAHLSEAAPPDLADLLAPPSVLGEVVSSLADAERLLSRSPCVLKPLFSTSGRGAQRLRGPGELAQRARWLEKLAERDGGVLCEPLLDRRMDLGVQIHVLPADADSPARTRIDGITRFFTDDRGQYRGALLGPLASDLPVDARRQLLPPTPGARTSRLVTALHAAAHRVGAALAERGFVGPAGIDNLVYRDPAGCLRLRPLLEVNPRWTMGHVSLALGRRLVRRDSPRWRWAAWFHLPLRTLERVGLADGTAFARAVGDRVCFTTDPHRATALVTCVIHGADRADALASLPEGLRSVFALDAIAPAPESDP